MFEVWQNSASFGGRPIGATVEALLTKVVNRQLSVLPIVVFSLLPLLVYHDQMATFRVIR
jgi:hypothetical protein